jgi:predicted ArsR family transcriptional regulator
VTSEDSDGTTIHGKQSKKRRDSDESSSRRQFSSDEFSSKIVQLLDNYVHKNELETVLKELEDEIVDKLSDRMQQVSEEKVKRMSVDLSVQIAST